MVMPDTSAPQRIGIFGGSFDPPHLGHEHLAGEAIRRLDLDLLLIVPAGRSPFKMAHESSAAQRLDMAAFMAGRIAGESAAGNACRVLVRRDEIEREGPSYSYLTLQTIAAEYPMARLFLLIGDDNLSGFTRWRSWREILALTDIAVVPRTGGAGAEALPPELAEYADSVHFIDSPVVPVSSTELRARLEAGQSIASMVNPDVHEFIRVHSIYMV
jgi:nicotinate-nucleotide adenylyltransferase